MQLQLGDWVRLRDDTEYDSQPWAALGQIEEIDFDEVRVLVRFGDGDLQWKSPLDLVRLNYLR